MQHELWMQRCLDLAILGGGSVSPNPMVGAVLVHEGRIIGEGYHKKFGGPHGEVEAISSVRPENRHLISQSTLNVNLEPCCHQGKTPPCTDLIISEQIPKVVIAMSDPNSLVNGAGIGRLRQAGVEVVSGVLEESARWLNRRFITFHEKHRPHIILKWAQTADGFIGRKGERIQISSALTHRLSHKWRTEEDAIMVGTGTARNDNPQLTARLWPGRNPLRVAVDVAASLPPSLNVFDNEAETLVLTQFSPAAMLDEIYQKQIMSVIIEGGAKLLTSFIETGLWDEARVFTSQRMLGDGVEAPRLSGKLVSQEDIAGDRLVITIP